MAVITTIRSAFGFLTRLPVGPWPLQNDLNGISAWLPLVGLVVGGLAGGLTWAATLLFPPLVCGVIGCACWVAITGGLHLDGVADCGDGLPVEVPRERRLEIMKDSRLGTFGGTALFFNLAFKGAALAALAAFGSWELLLTACALAGLLARSQIDHLRLLLSGDHPSHPSHHGKGVSPFLRRPDHHGRGHSGRDAPGSLCGIHAVLDAHSFYGSAPGPGLLP